MSSNRRRSGIFRALICATISIALLSTSVAASPQGQASQHARSVGITPAVANAANRARVSESYGKLPLSFEVNQGQTDPQVRFLARVGGQTLFRSQSQPALAWQKPKRPFRVPQGPLVIPVPASRAEALAPAV